MMMDVTLVPDGGRAVNKSQQNIMLLQQSNLDPAQSPQEMYLPTSNYAAMHVWTEILRGPWFGQIWADFEGEKEEGTSHC